MCNFDENQKSKDKYKVEPLQFKEHFSRMESTVGYERGFDEKKYLELEQQTGTLRKQINDSGDKYSKELNAELEKIKNLKPGEEYTQKTGTVIKYEDKKKWTGIKRKETDREYRDRVEKKLRSQSEWKHYRETDSETLKLQNADYYGRSEIVNRVNKKHVTKSLSENRKMILKRSISAMAKSDAGKDFNVPEGVEEDKLTEEERKKSEEAFKTFLDSVIEYGKYDGQYVTIIREADERFHDKASKKGKERKRAVSLRSGAASKEIELFMKMKDNLETAEDACGYDVNLAKTLQGYKDLLSKLADGDLEVPDEATELKISEIHDEQGKTIGMSKVNDKYEDKKIPLFAHEPSENDVMQGDIGDCYLVASLSSITSIEPQIIKNAIKDNGDTVTVKLFKPGIHKTEPVYIRVPKQQPHKMAANNALWVNMFELAYMEYKSYLKEQMDAIRDLISSEIATDGYKELTKKRDQIFDAFEKEADAPNKHWNSSKERRDARDWYYVEEMGKYLRSSSRGEKYITLLAKERKKAREANIIKGGRTESFIQVLTGVEQRANDVYAKRHSDDLNRLTFIYDDVMKNAVSEDSKKKIMKTDSYESQKKTLEEEIAALEEQLKTTTLEKDVAKAEALKLKKFLKKPEKSKAQSGSVPEKKEENESESARAESAYNEYTRLHNEIEAINTRLSDAKKEFKQYKERSDRAEDYKSIAECIIKKHLDDCICTENQFITEKEVFYTKMISRDQLGPLAEKAQKEFLEQGYIEGMLGGLTSKDSAAKIYKKYENDDQAKKEIADMAKALMAEFVKNKEKNTVLNYERFSGNYSELALKTYKDISDAVNSNKVITAGTFDFAMEGLKKEKTGESVFNGIASTHAYSIIGIKEIKENVDGKEKITHFVRVKNPWGSYHTVYEKNDQGKIEMKESRDTVTEGINEIELNDFMERFRTITYTDPKEIMQKQRGEIDEIREEKRKRSEALKAKEAEEKV